MQIYSFKKIKLIIIVFNLLVLNIGFSQQKTVNHKVIAGENLISIAKKYKIKTEDILELNPDARVALKINSLLIIPVAIDNKNNPKTHTVKSQETLYSISRQYNIKVADLKKWNPILESEELKVDQEIYLSDNKVSKKTKEVAKIITHEVTPKETKYAISKKYNISIENLEKENPEIVDGLPIGTKLKIPIEKELETNNSRTNYYSVKNLNKEILIDKLVKRASEQINVKYQSGGNNPKGFDCSGLMVYTFEISDLKLPRTSFEQSSIGKKIEKSDAKIGDLIFFGTNGIAQINHVGLIVEVNDLEIKFIHSSVRNGVIISSTNEPYYKKDFVQINNVLD